LKYSKPVSISGWNYENVQNDKRKNYIILWEYIKCVPPLTEVVGPTMNLINGIHHFYERREYTFNVLSEYNIITLDRIGTQIQLLEGLTHEFKSRRVTVLIQSFHFLSIYMFW
jgi:hypothetical protein